MAHTIVLLLLLLAATVKAASWCAPTTGGCGGGSCTRKGWNGTCRPACATRTLACGTPRGKRWRNARRCTGTCSLSSKCTATCRKRSRRRCSWRQRAIRSFKNVWRPVWKRVRGHWIRQWTQKRHVQTRLVWSPQCRVILYTLCNCSPNPCACASAVSHSPTPTSSPSPSRSAIPIVASPVMRPIEW